jgi:hypothetical protein
VDRIVPVPQPRPNVAQVTAAASALQFFHYRSRSASTMIAKYWSRQPVELKAPSPLADSALQSAVDDGIRSKRKVSIDSFERNLSSTEIKSPSTASAHRERLN